MSITAKDLAQRLGLSPAAISMALNGKPGVSDERRREILAAAERYGYDFSKLRERRQDQRNVRFIHYSRQGAVVGDTPFFAELLQGIEAGCKAEGCRLQVSYLSRADDVARQLRDIVHAGCSGVLVLGTEMMPEDFAPFDKLPLPVVLLDAYFDEIERDCVLINNVQGAFLATSDLIARRSCQPGYLRSAYTIGNFQERADGFYKAIRYHGMSPSMSGVCRLTPSVDGAYADMMALLDGGERLAKCYFADNDWIAIGAMKAFRAKGLRIPADVGIVGFDDIPLAGFIDPPLSTVHVPKRAMGEAAAKRLIEVMEGRGGAPMKIEISTRLMGRRSV